LLIFFLVKRRNIRIEIKEKKEAYYLFFFIDSEGLNNFDDVHRMV